jgi:hypothetical protein
MSVPSAWRTRWAVATVAVAVAATALDATLLQIRRGYFTGGFLAVDHLTGVAEGLIYIVLSLLTDAAVAGILIALLLWVGGRLHLARRPATGLAICLVLLPIVLADVVAYQIASYVGDLFDFGLMFELAGQSPAELLAVSAEHLPRLLPFAVAVCAGVAACIWMLSRGAAAERVAVEDVAFFRAFPWPAALFLCGAAAFVLGRIHDDVLDNGLRRKPTGRLLTAAIVFLSDVDRDGAGFLGRPPDPDLFDAEIRPYGIDIPGNGIDEDGIAGDLPTDDFTYTEPLPAAARWQSTPDVVLIVLESFRFDARGATYHGKPVTPVLDALAARGISVSHAFSPNGYTVQSRRHIFAGTTADIRGETTLIDDFHANGYETGYFSGQDESFGGAAGASGFDRADVAYDARADRERRYTTFSTAGSLAIPWTIVRDRVRCFLDARDNDRPLFLYVNFEDTHFPYHHAAIDPLITGAFLSEREITPDRREALRGMYLNTAANVDRAIGEVLAAVRRVRGREPAVIVLADHGESLFDEGFLGHGYALNDAQTRIPLIVANLPAAIDEPFSQADLRDLIGRTLAATPGGAVRPVTRSDPSRAIFQYLGTIDRPGQIALTTASGRTIYDFRARCATVDAGPCIAPDKLSAEKQSTFRTLVHTWERMMIARHSPAAVPE